MRQSSGAEDDRRDGELLVQERFGWFASLGWELVTGQPLQLASIAKSCGVRTVATKLLDKAGISWREVSLEGVWQPSGQRLLEVWQLHHWQIASLRLELSTSGIGMGFPVEQVCKCVHRRNKETSSAQAYLDESAHVSD
jgi:hypothetical protein